MTTIEIEPWRAAGLSQKDFEANLARMSQSSYRAPWLGQRVAVSAFLDYCSACTAQAAEVRRRLAEEARASRPKVEIRGAYDVEGIKRRMATPARLFGLPPYLAELSWRCIRCAKSVTVGEVRNPEEPALKWIVPPTTNQLGQVTAGELTASLCTKCAPIVDQETREAVQKQPEGASKP
jgi:hypothetical protein